MDLNLYWIKGALALFVFVSSFFIFFLTTCARWSWIGYSAFESTLNSSFVSYHLCESQYWHLYYLAFTTASCITHLPSTNRLRYFSLRAAFMNVRLGDSTYWLLSLLTQQFLADRTNGRAYATVLRLSVRLSVTLCIEAKRCVLEQKLLLRAYRKSYMRNRLVPKWMTLTFV